MIKLASVSRFFIKIGFITFFFGISVAELEDVRFYYGESLETINWGDTATEAVIKVNGSYYTKPYKSIKNALMVEVLNYDIGIEYGNGTKIDATRCNNINGFGRSRVTPFLVVHDDYGKFQYALIINNNDYVRTNMKLFWALLTQNQQFSQNTDYLSTTTDELTPYGSCNVTYNIEKNVVNGSAEELDIEKIYDTKSCKIESESLPTYCNITPEMDWNLSSSMNIEKLNEFSAIRNLEIDEDFSFNPFKNDDKILFLSQRSALHFVISPLTNVTSDLSKIDTEALTKIYKTEMNQSILNDTKNNKHKELRDMYRALSCSPVRDYTLLHVLEILIRC